MSVHDCLDTVVNVGRHKCFNCGIFLAMCLYHGNASLVIGELVHDFQGDIL